MYSPLHVQCPCIVPIVQSPCTALHIQSPSCTVGYRKSWDSAHFTPKVGVLKPVPMATLIPKLLQTWDFNRTSIASLHMWLLDFSASCLLSEMFPMLTHDFCSEILIQIYEKSPKFWLYPKKLVTVPPTLNMIDNEAQILIPRLIYSLTDCFAAVIEGNFWPSSRVDIVVTYLFS